MRGWIWTQAPRRGLPLWSGTMDENSPANAGVMSSIPGPGRSHMPWSS